MTREEAIQCIKHELLINVNRKDLTGQAIGEALDMAIDALQDRPTGTWIVSEGGNQWNEMDNLKCQNCGAKFKNVWDTELYNFCPNCGLRMKR